jgi:hypothetical protein
VHGWANPSPTVTRACNHPAAAQTDWRRRSTSCRTAGSCQICEEARQDGAQLRHARPGPRNSARTADAGHSETRNPQGSCQCVMTATSR